ncbi:MAG: methyl-accepting chemotaxis sensory transducer [uncultured bacterium]|nr:MAG: methyl-accepting chemotaxis sensory transducer [uncultured bacterium]
MKNWKLATKILTGFSVILVFLIATAWVGANSLKTIIGRAEKVDTIGQINTDVLKSRQHEKNFILRQSKEWADKVNEAIKSAKDTTTKLRTAFTDKINLDQMDAILSSTDSYLENFNSYVSMEDQKTKLIVEIRINADKFISSIEIIQKGQLTKLHENVAAMAKEIMDRTNKVELATKLQLLILEEKDIRKSIINQLSGGGAADALLLVKNDEHFAENLAVANTLKSMFTKQNNIDQVNTIIKANKDKEDALKRYLSNKNAEDIKIMNECEFAALKETQSITNDQKTKLSQEVTETGAKIIERTEKVQLTGEAVETFLKARIFANMYIASKNQKDLDSVSVYMKTIFDDLNTLKPRFTDPKDIEAVQTALDNANAYNTSLVVNFSGFVKKQINLETELIKEARSAEEKCREATINQKTKMQEQTKESLSLVYGFTLFAIIIGIVGAFWITSSITKPIRNIITNLSSGAEQVTSAAGQVAQSSQQMAEGASEQASSLEEVSSSLEEMASMTKQNSDNTKQANTMASEARNAAEEGTEAMKNMSAAINQIKHSSDQTAKIIKTIDEIAFQTNLLALNAAVEAARAGEAGKGFAVVAEEVRNLAQRSAQAAKNTSAMIEESQKNADNGVQVVTRVAEILNKISTGINKASQLMNEISVASEEQARGIDQVNTGVSQMDKVTQSNAANAEESASASEELSGQAVELKEMVEQLILIVEGANSNRTQTTASTQRRTFKTNKKTETVPAIQKKLINKEHSKFALRKTDTKNPETKVVNPNDVIPLDDKDLSEF